MSGDSKSNGKETKYAIIMPGGLMGGNETYHCITESDFPRFVQFLREFTLYEMKSYTCPGCVACHRLEEIKEFSEIKMQDVDVVVASSTRQIWTREQWKLISSWKNARCKHKFQGIVDEIPTFLAQYRKEKKHGYNDSMIQGGLWRVTPQSWINQDDAGQAPFEFSVFRDGPKMAKCWRLATKYERMWAFDANDPDFETLIMSKDGKIVLQSEPDQTDMKFV